MKNKCNENFSSCFKQYIKSMDQFNISFDFRVGDNFSYQTFVGGITYIFCLFLLSIYFLSNLISLLSDSEFNIRYYSEHGNNKVEIKKNDFFYYLLITNSDKTPISNFNLSQYFIIEQKLIERRNYEKNYTKTAGFPCPNDHKIEIIEQSYLYNNNLKSDFYCFEYPEFVLEGNYNTENFTYIEIDVKLNVNEYLRDKNEFNKIYESGNFNIFFIFSNQNLNFKKGIIDKSGISLLSHFYFGFYETFNIFFDSLDLKIDKNYFIKNYYPKNAYGYSHFEKNYEIDGNSQQSQIKPNDEFYINKFFIRSGNYIQYIDIYYQKLPDLLSNILALNKSLFFIFNIILSRWNSFKAKQSIFSRAFKFKDLFYTNFKEYKKIYPFDKQKTEEACNKIIFIDEKKLIDEKLKKSTESNNNKSDNSREFNFKGCKYLNNNEINIEKKDNIDSSRMQFSSPIKFIHLINKDVFISNNIRNSNISHKKSNDITEGILKNDNSNENVIKNLNELNKNNLSNDYIAFKLSNKNIQLSNPNALSYESKQILEEYVKNSLYKKYKASYKIDEKNLNPLKIRFRDYCLRYCFRRKNYLKRKIDPFELAEKNFNYYLDITTYIKRMNELDILKTILFHEDSKVLMEYISKPIIGSEFVNDSKNSLVNKVFKCFVGRNFLHSNTKLNKQSFDDIFFSYNNLKHNLNENDCKNKSYGLEYESRIENYFEKQMEYLFYDC